MHPPHPPESPSGGGSASADALAEAPAPSEGDAAPAPPDGRKTGSTQGHPDPQPSPTAVASKILALPSRDDTEVPPMIWRRSDFEALLGPAELPLLDTAIALLAWERQILCIHAGREGERYLLSTQIRRWIDPAPAKPTLDLGVEELRTAYQQAVRHSGGFPDVKIATLRRLLPAVAPSLLDEHLLRHWRQGEVTFSLGDWSLADQETRAAAIELAGERYLLVRFEKPDEEPLLS